MSLHGKSALITGASKGIGKAAALRLATDGAFVIVNYASDQKGAEDTVASITAAGAKAVALQADVSTLSGIQTMFTQVDQILAGAGYKTLDILVNNAGVYPTGSLFDTTEEDFDKIFNVNVKGLFFTTQEAQKRMGDGGRIINISTALTRFASNSMVAYSASKGAVEIMTRDMAQALGPKGITVNAINPGMIRTEGTAGMTGNSETVEKISRQTALGRIGEADDISGIIAFLASDQSRWVTAQKIEASGGYHL